MSEPSDEISNAIGQVMEAWQLEQIAAGANPHSVYAQVGVGLANAVYDHLANRKFMLKELPRMSSNVPDETLDEQMRLFICDVEINHEAKRARDYVLSCALEVEGDRYG